MKKKKKTTIRIHKHKPGDFIDGEMVRQHRRLLSTKEIPSPFSSFHSKKKKKGRETGSECCTCRASPKGQKERDESDVRVEREKGGWRKKKKNVTLHTIDEEARSRYYTDAPPNFLITLNWVFLNHKKYQHAPKSETTFRFREASLEL